MCQHLTYPDTPGTVCIQSTGVITLEWFGILTQYTVRVHKTHTYGMNATFKKCKTLVCWHHGSLATMDIYCYISIAVIHKSHETNTEAGWFLTTFNDCFTLEGGKSDEWRRYYGCSHSGLCRRTDMWFSAKSTTCLLGTTLGSLDRHTLLPLFFVVLCDLMSLGGTSDLSEGQSQHLHLHSAYCLWKRGTFSSSRIHCELRKSALRFKGKGFQLLKWHLQYASYKEKNV